MHITVLIGMFCFMWHQALWAMIFTSSVTLVTLAATLVTVCLLPVALGRVTNRWLCMGGQKLGHVLLRNVAVFLPYNALTIWMFQLFLNGWGNTSAAIYHTVGQVLFWLIGVLSVYLPHTKNDIISPSLCVFAAAPAILLLSNTGAEISVLLLCVVAWYFSIVFSYAAKSEAPLSRAAVISHSLIPLAAVILIVGLVFSGSLNTVFSQIKHLLLMLWQLLLMLLKLFDSPPQAYTPQPGNYISYGEAGEMMQELGPVNLTAVIILGICFAVLTLILLLRLLIGLLNLRLPQQASSAALRPRRRLGAGLLSALRLFGMLLRGLAEGIRATARALAGFIRLLCRLGKKWMVALMPPKTPLASVLRSYQGLLRFGHLMHINRTRSETPMEYLARLQAVSLKRPVPLAEAQALTWHMIAVQYAGDDASWQTADECRRLLRRIRRSLLKTAFTRIKDEMADDTSRTGQPTE